MKKLLLSCLVFILCLSTLPTVYASVSSEPIIHVKLRKLFRKQTQITLKPEGDYLTADRQILLKNKTEYQLKIESGKLKLYQSTRVVGQYESLTINPESENNLLYLNQRPYKVSFQFIPESVNGNQYIRPINHINLEEYIRGVVPFEMPASWSKEAVKA